MEAIGFSLALIAEARYFVTSIQTRIDNYRQGPTTFQTLVVNLGRLTELIGEVERLLRAAPEALSAETCTVVKSTCTSVREVLNSSHRTMEELTSAFGGSRNGVLAKVMSVLHRTARAKAFKEKMSAMEVQVNNSANQLLQLISVLSLAQKIDLNNEGTRSLEFRCAGTSAPALRPTVILNFDVRDADGELETPEGKLKHSVLCSSSSADVTAAAGVLKPAYGVVGMPGVGKTIALQGLAYDDDIRDRFVDGVLYMSLGQGATLQKVMSEIGRIMKISGARKLENSASLRDVIDEAIVWFSGKACLFLVDDLWPTATCETGYLRDLQQLLRDSPNSRMAITTRSVEIARDAGSVVHFDARIPTGIVSETIFMKYATVSLPSESYADLDPEVRSSVYKILSLCGGLPIALAVTGCGVAKFATLLGNFKSACSMYAKQLENKTVSLGDMKIPGGTSLNAGILLSLECLAENWKFENCPEMEHNVIDLYTSLCVLENQAWIPVSVLSRLWQLDEATALDTAKRFGEMSLASLSLRDQQNGSSECGLMLHDLQLEFCQRQVKEKNMFSRWHSQLLDGYLPSASSTVTSSLASKSSLEIEQNVLSFTPRQWWSERVPEDDYIHDNLAMHLTSSGSGKELAALLLDARWTHLRVRIGGILALQTDFEYLNKYMSQPGSWKNSFSEDFKVGFNLVLKALQLSWGRAVDGERALLFQICGRLHTVRHRNRIVDAYLKSMKASTAKPYLMPVTSFFPKLYRALIMELPLGPPVTCSLCGRYIAARAGKHDIAVVDASSGDVLQLLKGHTASVRSIVFAAESGNIVSGSLDKRVIVWKWEQSDLPVRILEGHGEEVTCVAVSSDGRRIFSSSADYTVRIWDLAVDSQSAVIHVGKHVSTLALCRSDRNVALGLSNGTMVVLDTCTGATVFEDIKAHKGVITSMALSPNSLMLATCSFDSSVGLWNTKTWTRLKGLDGDEKGIRSLAFSPDGQQIVSGSYEGYIQVWKTETRRTIGISPNLHGKVDSVAFSSDGKRIVSGSKGEGMVRIWDALLDAKSEQRGFGHSAPVRGVSISPDGARVVSGSGDGTLRLWDSQTGAQIGVPLEGHAGGVRCVSFSPDGRQIVSGSDDCTVRLWDTKKLLQIGDPVEGHRSWVCAVSFSFHGLRIVSGFRDGSVRIWRAATREQIGDALEGGLTYISGVSESSDGCHVVAHGCAGALSQTVIWHRDRRVIVWKSKGGESGTENKISDEEAEHIVRSCGQQTPHIWPRSFPSYPGEVYSNFTDVYSHTLHEKTSLGTLPSVCYSWKYNSKRKVFAAGLMSGAVALCKFVDE